MNFPFYIKLKLNKYAYQTMKSHVTNNKIIMEISMSDFQSLKKMMAGG